MNMMPGPPEDFENDDLLKEAFNEGVQSGKIAIRIVDTLPARRYCEAQIEDGVLYLQVGAHTRCLLVPGSGICPATDIS